MGRAAHRCRRFYASQSVLAGIHLRGDGRQELIVLGDVMLWLLVIGAVVLGCVLAYGILRARERLDRSFKRTQRSEDPQKRPF